MPWWLHQHKQCSNQQTDKLRSVSSSTKARKQLDHRERVLPLELLPTPPSLPPPPPPQLAVVLQTSFPLPSQTPDWKHLQKEWIAASEKAEHITVRKKQLSSFQLYAAQHDTSQYSSLQLYLIFLEHFLCYTRTHARTHTHTIYIYIQVTWARALCLCCSSPSTVSTTWWTRSCCSGMTPSTPTSCRSSPTPPTSRTTASLKSSSQVSLCSVGWIFVLCDWHESFLSVSCCPLWLAWVVLVSLLLSPVTGMSRSCQSPVVPCDWHESFLSVTGMLWLNGARLPQKLGAQSALQ